MSDHLIPYLRALAAGRHDDVSVAVDAVIEIERLTRERDEARAEVERLRDANRQLVAGIDTIARRKQEETDHLSTENARLRARIAEYFREPDTHPMEDA